MFTCMLINVNFCRIHVSQTLEKTKTWIKMYMGRNTFTYPRTKRKI